ncbi:MAG: LapA family protein [Nitrospirota bacterium]|nr:LapA family protein [Nitrospirota bacterium]
MPMFILMLIIAALVAIFSVQNAAPVTIAFLAWTFQASLAIVILLSTVMGVVLASAAFMLLRLKRAMRAKGAGKGAAGEKKEF